MKIFFDHIAGKTTNMELVYSPATAVFEEEEYAYAIQNGWHIAESWGVPDFDWYNSVTAKGQHVWYQARSSRIEISKFEERSRHRKKIKRAKVTCEIVKDVKHIAHEMLRILDEYCKAKNFVNFYQDSQDLLCCLYGPRHYLLYRDETQTLIGFGIVEVVNNEVAVSPQFAWDYKKPSIGLGSLNKIFQFRLMNDLSITHLYLGNSYEIPSLGKTKWPGFEWWNGRVWTSDLELYRHVLEKETAMKNLDDLYAAQMSYYSKLKC